ncbi:MAG: caspase family protein, partial [Pseudomonadales bacterium]
RARQTHEVFEQRALESYIDGYYQQQMNTEHGLHIPTSRHALLAACKRTEKAWESTNHSGVFTDTFLQVLGKSGNHVSYADLFVRCRLAVRKQVENQNPQFESFAYFNAHDGFLGSDVEKKSPRHSVYFTEGNWKIDCGAIHGLPTDLNRNTTVALYEDKPELNPVGHAQTSRIGAQKSDLSIDGELDIESTYRAEITSLPVMPTPVYVEGPASAVSVLSDALDESVNASFVDEKTIAKYIIDAKDDQFVLYNAADNSLIRGFTGINSNAATSILSTLRQVLTWERSWTLSNAQASVELAELEFWMVEDLPSGEQHVHKVKDLSLDYADRPVPLEFFCNNPTDRTLHITPIYYGSDYLVHVIEGKEIAPNTESMVLFNNRVEMDDETMETIDRVKMLVTTENVDDFLLQMEAIDIGKIGALRGASRGFTFSDEGTPSLDEKNNWLTHDIVITTHKQINKVSTEDQRIASQAITLKGHSSMRANVSLGSSTPQGRGAGMDINHYLRSLVPAGHEDVLFEAINLSSTRGEAQNVLEFSNIENAESLQETPLQLEVDLALRDDEFVLPLVFDGQHIMLGGEVSKANSGITTINIREFPTLPDNRRGLGGSLKLYFFKTYLNMKKLNKLRWVDYKNDGSLTQRRDGIAEKVAAAKKVVVLIHGITGDTKGSSAALRPASDGNAALGNNFDLVLSYDYENLATPIEQTALDLSQQLAAAGFHAGDDKHLTLLVHSMGGLVSRWFIEKLDGHSFVDHLVMCGTPNNGSPFGKIGTARTILGGLSTLALNTFPIATPYCAIPLMLMERSKKLTPCLEQMNPASDFMQQLNAQGSDPGVRYTILAGNIAAFDESSDQFLKELISKVGKGSVLEALFDTTEHDIAVSQLSIRGVPEHRRPAPNKINVGCHHLNYFNSESGLAALLNIEW